MMDKDALVQDVKGGIVVRESYCDIVFRNYDYQIRLLPRLAPTINFNEVWLVSYSFRI